MLPGQRAAYVADPQPDFPASQFGQRRGAEVLFENAIARPNIPLSYCSLLCTVAKD